MGDRYPILAHAIANPSVLNLSLDLYSRPGLRDFTRQTPDLFVNSLIFHVLAEVFHSPRAPSSRSFPAS